MDVEIKFKRKRKSDIDMTPIEDGSLLFTTDDNKIYMDVNGVRKEYAKTPVKGVDYWNQGDKNYIIQEVMNSLSQWNGGNY